MSDTFHIELNGKSTEVVAGTTVSKLIAQKIPNVTHVAAEVNGTLLPKSQHAEHILKVGDIVELVTFVGGG